MKFFDYFICPYPNPILITIQTHQYHLHQIYYTQQLGQSFYKMYIRSADKIRNPYKQIQTNYHKYPDPVHFDSIRYQLSRPYDSHYGNNRVRTEQLGRHDYWYERQLLSIQKQSLQRQLSQEKLNNQQSERIIRDLASGSKQGSKNIDKINGLPIKHKYTNNNTNGNSTSHKTLGSYNSYESQVQKTMKNNSTMKQKSQYEEIYKASPSMLMNSPPPKQNFNHKLTNSMLGSPSQENPSLNNQLQYTSKTKAAIFRRLYDEKSKKTKNQFSSPDANKQDFMKNKSENFTKIKSNRIQQQEQSDQPSEEIANYLEQISFLKAQLQQKNKTIVDLQCQLIKKSTKKTHERQRHKSDFGVKNNLKKYHEEQHQSKRQIKNQLQMSNNYNIQINNQHKKKQLSIVKIPTQFTISNLNEKTNSSIKLKIQKTDQILINKSNPRQIKNQAAQTLPFDTIIQQAQPNNINMPINVIDNQSQTQDNWYDYIQSAVDEWVFQKDYQQLKKKRQLEKKVSQNNKN